MAITIIEEWICEKGVLKSSLPTTNGVDYCVAGYST